MLLKKTSPKKNSLSPPEWEAICAVEGLHLTDEQRARVALGREAILAHYKGSEMTITVQVLNKAHPNYTDKHVKIEVQDRDANGRFVEVLEVYVAPGRYEEVTLHDGNQIRLSESELPVAITAPLEEAASGDVQVAD